MSLWRLEVLRMVRTRRWLALVGVFVAFGFLGPLSAKYLPDLVAHAGSGIKIIVAPPKPADGIRSYLGNAMQIGLVVTVVVAVSAFAFDRRPGLAIFYRTHVRRAADLVLPRYTVAAATAIGAFVLGSLSAVYETEVLLGHLPPVRLIEGIALEGLYLLFACAVAAAACGVVRGSLAATGLSVGALLALPIAGSIGRAGHWLPSDLVGSMSQLAMGHGAGEYRAAALASLGATAVLLMAAIASLRRREI